MSEYAEKSAENKSISAAHQITQYSKAAVQFTDNRPQAIAQMKLQDTINGSARVHQLKTYQQMADNSHPVKQLKPNHTGLPDTLKAGIERLSGHSMDDVKVHYNSAKPAQLQAHAYAQGTEIHLGKGQEKHLPHEAWHVVQQKQNRVKANLQMKGHININDNAGLEKESDIMGAKAIQLQAFGNEGSTENGGGKICNTCDGSVVQRMVGLEFETSKVKVDPKSYKSTLGSGDGFKVEGDNGNLEIVTNPFPTTAEGKAGLVNSVIKATNFVSSISGPVFTTKLNTKKVRDQFAGISWKASSYDATMIRKDPVTCHPQVTMGIPLSTMVDMYHVISKDQPAFDKVSVGRLQPNKKENLPHFAMDQRGKDKWLAMKGHIVDGLRDAEESVLTLKAKLMVDKAHNTDKLSGLLTQILTSINSAMDEAFMGGAGWNSHNVGKNQFVLLPKTKLHFLYNLLSNEEKLMFVDWVNHAAPHKEKVIFGNLTIGDWLINIYDPSKGMEFASQDEQIEGLGSAAYQGNAKPDRTLKSMTDSLGSPVNIGNSKDDKNESGGIFEFRHLKAVVPLNEWPDVAQEAMTLAMWLELNAKLKENKPEEGEA